MKVSISTGVDPKNRVLSLFRRRWPGCGIPAPPKRLRRRRAAGAADFHGPLWTGIIAWSETWYIADREARYTPVFVAVFSIFT